MSRTPHSSRRAILYIGGGLPKALPAHIACKARLHPVSTRFRTTASLSLLSRSSLCALSLLCLSSLSLLSRLSLSLSLLYLSLKLLSRHFSLSLLSRVRLVSPSTRQREECLSSLRHRRRRHPSHRRCSRHHNIHARMGWWYPPMWYHHNLQHAATPPKLGLLGGHVRLVPSNSFRQRLRGALPRSRARGRRAQTRQHTPPAPAEQPRSHAQAPAKDDLQRPHTVTGTHGPGASSLRARRAGQRRIPGRN
eukprot:COSAG06_NODE_677_length_13149_cov_37.657854_9_plen_250_part_00